MKSLLESGIQGGLPDFRPRVKAIKSENQPARPFGSLEPGVIVMDIKGTGRTQQMNRSFSRKDFEASTTNDYSGAFSKMRPHLVNSGGVHIANFVRDLKPNYGRVYFDIALGILALATIL